MNRAECAVKEQWRRKLVTPAENRLKQVERTILSV